MVTVASRLEAERVEQIFRDCLFKDGEDQTNDDGIQNRHRDVIQPAQPQAKAAGTPSHRAKQCGGAP